MNFEFRQRPIRLQTILAAILIGVLVGVLLLLMCGYNPAEIFGTLWDGSFGSLKSIAAGLRWATPLMLTGIAAAIAFRGGMFNFGIDGQMYVGGLAGTIVGLTMVNLPGVALIPLMLLTSMVFGALWAFIPAYTKVRLGGSEIVPALMLNYAAAHLTDYIVHYHFLAPGQGDSLKTERIAEQAILPKFDSGYQLTTAIFIGLAVVVLFWIIVKKSKMGYGITMSGLNLEFARYGGIDVNRTRMLVMLLSGALAGLAGAVEIMSIRWRFESGFVATLGNDGILAALLGNSTPIGTLLGSLFMGFLKAGSLNVERFTEVSRVMTTVIQATIICFISARLISYYIGFDKLASILKDFLNKIRRKTTKGGVVHADDTQSADGDR